MSAQLYLVNPPAERGRSHERAQSGGLGVARKLKLFEPETVEVLPHDFLYQAAVAEAAGHRVQFVDLPLERIYDFDKALAFTRRVIDRGLSEDPAAQVWIGVRISIVSLRSDVELANRLKHLLPTARVYAFGNVLMTTHRHWCGDAHFDYLIYGEPEAIIGEAMAADDPSAVPGIIDLKTYRVPDGTDLFSISATATYRGWRKVQDISQLPRAAWHLLELGRYAPQGRLSELALTIPASRGCFMPCTMCAYSLGEGRLMRFRTPEEVVDEIEYLHHTYGIRRMRFRDPNFSANKPHLQAIAQGLIDRRLSMEIAAELSLELLDRGLMELMYRAGIRTILTGVESNDPEIMLSIGQNVRINRILEEKVKIAHEVGLKLYTFFIIGAPEETWHTVQDTFRFARSLGTESTMTIMTPFPGTAMYWRALYENLLVRGREMRYEDWNSYTATMRTYRMPIRDVTIARTWARLETYIPYAWNQARGSGLAHRSRVVSSLAPRVLALGAFRLYANWKLRQEERQGPVEVPNKVRVVAGQGLIPVPVIQNGKNDHAARPAAQAELVTAGRGADRA